MSSPSSDDLPEVAVQLARDEIEIGRLAGAVRADDGGERAGRETARHVVDGHMAAEANREPARFERGRRRRSRYGHSRVLQRLLRTGIGILSAGIVATRSSRSFVVLAVGLDLEVIHRLQRLMVFLAEGHRALRRLEGHAFHRRDQLLGVGAASLLDRRDDRGCGGEAAGGEEVRRRVEALLVLGDEPVVHRVLREGIVVIDRAFHAGIILVDLHGRQDVAARRELDAEALGLQVGDLRQRMRAGPDDVDDLACRACP